MNQNRTEVHSTSPRNEKVGRAGLITQKVLQYFMFEQTEVQIEGKDQRRNDSDRRKQSRIKSPYTRGTRRPKMVSSNLWEPKCDAGRPVRDPTYAVASFPEVVRLCKSSIPGEGYGVCGKHHIPAGTWIGPYEGRRVEPHEVTVWTDTSYMWEIFNDGKLAYFLDGRDESCSSWMRFIRCARHKGEQNMFAFQYMGNIYYRAYKDIPEGAELLVWYDDSYPQYMGIPLEVHEMATLHFPGPPSRGAPLVPGSTTPQQAQQSVSCDLHVTSTQCDPHGPEDGEESCVERSTREPNQANRLVKKAHETCGMNSNTAASKCREEARLNKQTDGTTDWTLTSKSHTGRLMKNTKAPQETDEEFACPRARGTELQVTIKQSGSSLGGNVFRCGQCSKNFNQRSTLQNHVCSRLARYPFKCGYCCKGFAQPNELRSHAIIHTSEKPFKCGFCARSFAGATTLNNHIRTHTGERPFSCQKCDKTFAQASQLSRHQRFSDSCLE